MITASEPVTASSCSYLCQLRSLQWSLFTRLLFNFAKKITILGIWLS